MLRLHTGLTKKKKFQKLIKEFEKGDPEKLKNVEVDGKNAHLLPFNKDYEVSGAGFSIDRRAILGSGEFGVIYKGKLLEFEVAVKTVTSTADLDYLKAFLIEVKIMTMVEKHPNVVQLLGTSTNRIRERVIYVMVELGIHGSLHAFLKEHESSFVDDSSSSLLFAISQQELNWTGSPESSSKMIITVTTRDLITWSGHIASGMSHLASKKIIHGDLSARNVLLFDDFTAKITDFGLERHLYKLSNCIKNEEPPCSWRIMAPESLKDLEFSTKSDVWSFGVLLWEMFSMGAIPYSRMGWTLGFHRKLVQGLRLQMPKWATHEINYTMKTCWNLQPETRPSFEQLEKFFHDILLRPPDDQDRIFITRL